MLAALQDRYPDFSDHVLALSGVSGGNVGASVFAALAEPTAQSAVQPACREAGGMSACARAIGGGDLLSAPLASMLLSEPFNRITARIEGADRAAALDRALERAWRQTMGTDRFGAPFASLAAGRMLVLPNSTSAATGERLVITPLDAGDTFKPAEVLDGRVFKLSTATLLSARFPGLSPAGLYETAPDTWLRIVDGGYADSSGAATGKDVLNALVAALERSGRRFQPVVIAISNSSEIVARSWIDRFRTITIGTLLDPVITLDSVRSGVSKRFEADLCARVNAEQGIYLGGMRLLHGDSDLPLGWMLAPSTARIIDLRLEELKADRKSDFNRVGALLAASKTGLGLD